METQTNSASLGETLLLQVNGEPRKVVSGTTIAGLLTDLGIAGGKVAVERNKAIAPRSSFNVTQLEAGDAIEIVRFVGGG